MPGSGDNGLASLIFRGTFLSRSATPPRVISTSRRLNLREKFLL